MSFLAHKQAFLTVRIVVSPMWNTVATWSRERGANTQRLASAIRATRRGWRVRVASKARTRSAAAVGDRVNRWASEVQLGAPASARGFQARCVPCALSVCILASTSGATRPAPASRRLPTGSTDAVASEDRLSPPPSTAGSSYQLTELKNVSASTSTASAFQGETDFNLRLMEAVREHPCLYDPSNSNYGNKHMNAQVRAAVWQRLLRQLGYPCDVHSLQMHWKRLRDRFVKERRKRRIPGAIFDDELLGRMHWLNEYIIEAPEVGHHHGHPGSRSFYDESGAAVRVDEDEEEVEEEQGGGIEGPGRGSLHSTPLQPPSSGMPEDPSADIDGNASDLLIPERQRNVYDQPRQPAQRTVVAARGNGTNKAPPGIRAVVTAHRRARNGSPDSTHSTSSNISVGDPMMSSAGTASALVSSSPRRILSTQPEGGDGGSANRTLGHAPVAKTFTIHSSGAQSMNRGARQTPTYKLIPAGSTGDSSVTVTARGTAGAVAAVKRSEASGTASVTASGAANTMTMFIDPTTYYQNGSQKMYRLVNVADLDSHNSQPTSTASSTSTPVTTQHNNILLARPVNRKRILQQVAVASQPPALSSHAMHSLPSSSSASSNPLLDHHISSNTSALLSLTNQSNGNNGLQTLRAGQLGDDLILDDGIGERTIVIDQQEDDSPLLGDSPGGINSMLLGSGSNNGRSSMQRHHLLPVYREAPVKPHEETFQPSPGASHLMGSSRSYSPSGSGGGGTLAGVGGGAYQSLSQYDHDLAFQQLISTHLARLNEDDKAVMKMNIQRILLDARFGSGTTARIVNEDDLNDPVSGSHDDLDTGQ